MYKTLGLSPKLTAAILAAVLSYLLTQTVLELPAGVVLTLQVVAVAAAVYRAGPGLLVGPEEGTPRSEHTGLGDEA